MKTNRTVQRALHVLHLVASSPGGLRLSELATALDVPKTSVFDIVSTMLDMHYLRKHDNKFFIGIKVKEDGESYATSEDLCDIASSFLVAASGECNASTSLVFVVNDELKYLFQHHPKDAVMIARHPSPFNIFHASAAGKVLLACMDPEKRERLISTMAFHRFTDNTISNAEELRGVLEQTTVQGYALDNREYHYLLQCVAAPVVHQDKTIAAISFSALNLYKNDPSSMIACVLRTARQISQSAEIHLR